MGKIQKDDRFHRKKIYILGNYQATYLWQPKPYIANESVEWRLSQGMCVFTSVFIFLKRWVVSS